MISRIPCRHPKDWSTITSWASFLASASDTLDDSTGLCTFGCSRCR